MSDRYKDIPYSFRVILEALDRIMDNTDCNSYAHGEALRTHEKVMNLAALAKIDEEARAGKEKG